MGGGVFEYLCLVTSLLCITANNRRTRGRPVVVSVIVRCIFQIPTATASSLTCIPFDCLICFNNAADL